MIFCHWILSFNIKTLWNVDIWWASRPRTPTNRLKCETDQKDVCDGYETRICMVSAPKTDSNLRNRCRPTYVQHLFFIVKTIWKLIFGWPTSKFCYKTNMRRWHFEIELQVLLQNQYETLIFWHWISSFAIKPIWDLGFLSLNIKFHNRNQYEMLICGEHFGHGRKPTNQPSSK